MDEDKTLCAGVQRGLGARTYERGVLNRNERAIAHYHDLLREPRAGHRRPRRGVTLAHRLHERGERRDRWRFLTPEVERLVPSLVAALAPSAGLSVSADELEARLDELVRDGTPDEWFAELRRCRTLLEAAVAGDAPGPLVHRLALILREQYLLAPAVVDPVPDSDAELARLDALVRLTHPTPTIPA